VPSTVVFVSRNGVVQSHADGHWSNSGQVFTFTTAFDGTERVVVAYISNTYVPPANIAGTIDTNLRTYVLAKFGTLDPGGPPPVGGP